MARRSDPARGTAAARRALRAGVAAVPGARALAGRARRHLGGGPSHLRVRIDVAAAGIFDPEWYRRQTGERLRGDAVALEHYLTRGRRAGLTPSPLFDPAWYDPKGWRTASTDPLARYVRRGPGRRGPHPMFDEARWVELHPEAADHPGRGLGHFLSVATATTPVPVRGDHPPTTWGRLRDLLAEANAEWDAQHEVARPRRSVVPPGRRPKEQRDPFAAHPAPSGGDGPLVTVVTPVRNRPTQVLAAIASVQTQTLTDWELVVVDDGSTDTTPEAVAVVAAADPRVRLVRGPGEGVCAARNRGIASARGRYVAFLDSDNTWRPQFLLRMARHLHHTGLRAAYSGLLSLEGHRTMALRFRGGLPELAYGNHVDLNTLVVERSLLDEVGGFDPALRRMVDYDLVVRLAQRTNVELVDFVGTVYDNREDSGPRISTTESPHWDQVVKNRLFLDWDALREGCADRVPGRVSVLLVGAADAAVTVRAVTHLRRHAGPDDDVEIVVLDDGGPRGRWLALATALRDLPGLQLQHSSRTLGPVLGTNVAFARSTGEVVVVLGADVVVDGPWCAPLRDALAADGVRAAQPVVLGPGGDVVTVGLSAAPPADATAGTPATLAPVLAGFAARDAACLDGHRVPLPGGPAVALHARDVAAGGGLDPLLSSDVAAADLLVRLDAVGTTVVRADVAVRRLSQRPAASLPGDDHERRVLVERQRAGHRLPTADDDPYAVLGLRRTGPGPGDVERRPGGPGVRRWAIRTAAPAGPPGDSWGDVHFAEALASALTAQGEHAVVDRRTARRAGAHLDDVVLVLRGLDVVPPVPGAVNLVWVISHPDDVSAEELAGYDAVLAASPSWARATSASTGVPVLPLLQATDPDVFRPDGVRPGTGPRVLFVGNSRDVDRPVVRHALEAGLPLRVYGSGWQGRLDPAVLAGRYVANRDVPALYRSAGVVMNDHWADMGREGFLSNRLFDAVAAGARVVTDDVPGLREVFGPEVQVASSAADLARLLGTATTAADGEPWVPGPPFPTEEELLAASARVRAEHSFAARARTLREVADRARAQGPRGLA